MEEKERKLKRNIIATTAITACTILLLTASGAYSDQEADFEPPEDSEKDIDITTEADESSMESNASEVFEELGLKDPSSIDWDNFEAEPSNHSHYEDEADYTVQGNREWTYEHDWEYTPTFDTLAEELGIVEVDYTGYAVRSANLREDATTEAEVEGSLAFRESIRITGEVKGDEWLRGELNGEEVFVEVENISKTQPAPPKVEEKPVEKAPAPKEEEPKQEAPKEEPKEEEPAPAPSEPEPEEEDSGGDGELPPGMEYVDPEDIEDYDFNNP